MRDDGFRSCRVWAEEERGGGTYWNAIRVFLTDALGLSLALLKGVFVLKLAEEVLACCLSFI